MGGFLYTTGRTDAPPMGTVLEQMAIVTARNAAIAIMALLRQRLSGTGQHIDVSIMEAVVSTPPTSSMPIALRVPLPARGFGDQTVMDGMHLATSDLAVTLTRWHRRIHGNLGGFPA